MAYSRPRGLPIPNEKVHGLTSISALEDIRRESWPQYGGPNGAILAAALRISGPRTGTLKTYAGANLLSNLASSRAKTGWELTKLMANTTDCRFQMLGNKSDHLFWGVVCNLHEHPGLEIEAKLAQIFATAGDSIAAVEDCQNSCDIHKQAGAEKRQPAIGAPKFVRLELCRHPVGRQCGNQGSSKDSVSAFSRVPAHPSALISNLSRPQTGERLMFAEALKQLKVWVSAGELVFFTSNEPPRSWNEAQRRCFTSAKKLKFFGLKSAQGAQSKEETQRKKARGLRPEFWSRNGSVPFWGSFRVDDVVTSLAYPWLLNLGNFETGRHFETVTGETSCRRSARTRLWRHPVGRRRWNDAWNSLGQCRNVSRSSAGLWQQFILFVLVRHCLPAFDVRLLMHESYWKFLCGPLELQAWMIDA